MPTEIERKFLVKDSSYKDEAYASERIVQGYLSSVPARSVRVRIKGDAAYLTIKGIGSASGMSRYEWEKPIAQADAEQLLQLCEPGAIVKTRYCVRVGGKVFEVDDFDGDNAGLVMAEIELQDEAELFDCPAWLGDEVTGDNKYYNASLTKNPYRNWKE